MYISILKYEILTLNGKNFIRSCDIYHAHSGNNLSSQGQYFSGQSVHKIWRFELQPFQRNLRGCKILKWVMWTWPRPFQGCLSLAGWDLLWLTYGPNLKSKLHPLKDKKGRKQKCRKYNLCIYLVPFSRYMSYLPKFTKQLQPIQPAFGIPTGGDPTQVLPRSLAPENQSHCAIVWHCLPHRTFSHFSRTLPCDTHTHTHRHRAIAYTELA